MARRVITLAVAAVCLALFWTWFNDSNVPEPIPEKFKVKVIDASQRLFFAVANVLVWSGVTYPLSPLLRSLADQWLLFQITGNPWWEYSGDGLVASSRTFSGVHVRMYEPTLTLEDRKRPVLVYIHGGAWTWLSAELYEPFTSRIAEEAQVVVVSVNYRLAPGVVFPEPRSDCAAVMTYILEHGDELGIDTSRVAVGGDSAGGNLAASLSLEFKQLRAQLLLVPALQPFDSWTSSDQENEKYLEHTVHARALYVVYLIYGGLNPDLVPFIANNSHVSPEVKKVLYSHKINHNKLVPPEIVRTPELKKRTHNTSFGDVAVWKQVKDVFTNPYFAPLSADDEMLKGLAPAYVMTAGYDIIRDDGVMYYSRLSAVGNKAVLKNYEEGFHNALMFHSGPLKLDCGEKVVVDIVAYLKENL